MTSAAKVMASANHVPARLEPYYSIIQAHFDVPRSPKELSALYTADDAVWNTNGWTAQLLEKLLTEIHQHNPAVSREQLRRADCAAAGHSDWHRKLAVACAELVGR